MTTKTQQKSPSSTAIPGKKLIAVASGKGGVGKTWMSITLSHALAQQGKKVLLFDGDLGLANVDVQLGLIARRDISDVVEGNLGMENAIQKYEEGGFDVIAGRSGQGALSTLPVTKLNETVQDLRALLPKYDVIIIDLGAGIDRTVRFMAAAADATFVVTTDEPTSLTDAYAFIKLNHAAGHSDNIHIIVNMTDNYKEGETTYATLTKACKSFLKFTPPLLGLIRTDKRVRDTIRAQTLYLTRNPNTDTAEDILRVSERISEEVLP